MLNRGLRVFALSTVVLAGTAAAATGPVTATVTPDTVSSPSAFSITVSGSLPPGLPSQLEFTAQPGFTGSIKGAKALCTSTQASSNACPAGSVIGSGSVVTTTLGTIPLTLAAAAPSQSGDLGTVYLIGKVGTSTLVVDARYFVPSGGGLELLITQFPNVPGVSITSLTLSAKAINTVVTKTVTHKTVGHGKHKHTKKVTKVTKTTYSVINNPSTCPASGTWTGTVVATFSSGPVTLPFTVACAGGTGTTGATGTTGT